MAYIFARYAHHLVPIAAPACEYLGWIGYAAGAIAVLSLVNIVGVREGKWTQNVLTTAKVLGLAAVAAVGLWFAAPEAAPVAATTVSEPNYSLAMILVLFAYGGWSEMVYVAAEVRDPKRNILRAMLLGTVAVAAIYTVVNLAFIHSLGLGGFRGAKAVAGEVLQLGLGAWGDRVDQRHHLHLGLERRERSDLHGCASYYAMGSDHRIYAPLGRWSRRTLAPPFGRWPFRRRSRWRRCSLSVFSPKNTLTAAGFGSGFERMVIFTTPIFWGFLVLVGLALFVLRWREPEVLRPYRVPLYPWIPIVFCSVGLFMAYSGLRYAISNAEHTYEALWALVAMAIGIVATFFDTKAEPECTDASRSPDNPA